MAFPASFLEEVKSRSRIVDIIGGFVPLKRAGSNYIACCPFHNEKTPSFTVFERSESFYCFGCGAGGDVITFVMKTENVDYPEAVEILAKRAGLNMPIDSAAGRSEADKRRRILAINKDAAKFFSRNLLSGKYPRANAYIEKRSLAQAARHFGLGYCPPERRALADYMLSLGYKAQELKDAFLCGISNDGQSRVFDYYSDRIIFPIIDTQGNVIAFGGRTLGDAQPKYLNSNDTPAFKKRKNLFALNFAKNTDADYFILCEGYTDVISLHMAGFTSAVASLGTAFTEEQAALMKKYKAKVVVCYDGDEAGQRAIQKAIRLLEPTGMEVKVLKLPDNLDPDDFIKQKGKERFELLLRGSSGQVEYRCNEIISRYDVTNTEQRLAAARETGSVIAGIYSQVERSVYAVQIAEKLQIPPDSFKSDIERMHRQHRKKEDDNYTSNLQKIAQGYSDRVNPDMVKMTKACYAEEAILGIAQIHPDYVLKGEKEGILSEADFMTAFNKTVYKAITEALAADDVFDIAVVAQSLTAEQMSRVIKMRVMREQLSDNTYAVYTQYAEALRREKESSDDGDSDPTLDDIQKLIERKKLSKRKDQT